MRQQSSDCSGLAVAISSDHHVARFKREAGLWADGDCVRGCADPKPTLRDSENHGFECPAPQLFSVGHALGG